MPVRQAVAVLGAGILLLANSTTPASAQNDTCIDVYNHSMATYYLSDLRPTITTIRGDT